MDPIILHVGEQVSDDILNDDEQCERPIHWYNDDGEISEVMSAAWLSSLDLRYYRRMFSGQKQYSSDIMKLWNVPESIVQQVMEIYQDLEDILYNVELDNKSKEELTLLAESIWSPKMLHISELIEPYRT